MTKACVAVVVVAAAAAAAAVASAARVSSQARCRSHSLCVSVRSCRPSSSRPVWPCDAVPSRDSSPRVCTLPSYLRFTYLRDFVTLRASQDTKCMSHEKLMPATAWSHDAGSSSSSRTGRGGGGGRRATIPRSLHRLFMTGALLGAVLWIDFVSGEVRDHIGPFLLSCYGCVAI